MSPKDQEKEKQPDISAASYFYAVPIQGNKNKDEGDVGLATRAAVNGDHIVLRTNGHTIEVLEGVQAQCSGLAAQIPDQNC